MTIDWEISRPIHGAESEELSRRIGALSQVARIDSFTENEGAARGARRIRLITGGGLEAEIHPDRALDIGHVTFRGAPVAWASPGGVTSPQLAASQGTEWLRSFGGGLLSTCGLDTIGPPSVDEGIEYPMHGRIGTVPATVTRTSVCDGRIRIEGEVRQTTVFGENLVLRREITAEVGGSTLRVRDTVTNEGLQAAGILVLYHANLGWPLLDERATLEIDSRHVTPRDETAVAGVARWHEIDPPTTGYREQVFLHDFQGRPGRAGIDNPEADLRLELTFDTSTLPALHQWKMAGEGHYVMGLEPANTCQIQGRAAARAANKLPTLMVGESTSYALNFHFSPSAKGSGS